MLLAKLRLTQQFNSANKSGLTVFIYDAALRNKLSAEFVLAVASRETNIRNILGYNNNGVGVMQIDVRWHLLAKEMKEDGSWKTNPFPLIDYGCRLLKHNYAWAAEHFPYYSKKQHYKIAAAAYNAGIVWAERGIRKGNCDIYTTHGDYGLDIEERMEVFKEIIDGRYC